MAFFTAAMDATHGNTLTDYAVGENGGLNWSASGVGDQRLALFVKLVRTLPDESLNGLLSEAHEEAAKGPPAATVDLFVMAMQTRDVRGGKGERALAYKLLIELHSVYPETVRALIPVIPEYGCWKDCVLMIELLQAASPPDPAQAPLLEALITAMVDQLRKDESAEKPSLLGKWAPRQGNKHSKLAKTLAERLFPGAKNARELYRKLIVPLARKLDVAEQHMCEGTWADINPTAIPARCLKQNRRALLNEPLPPRNSRKRRRIGGAEDVTAAATAVRYPDRPDRVKCAENVKAVLEAAKADPAAKGVHGAVLHPHELVQQYMKAWDTTVDEILEAQWRDLRQKLLAKGTLNKLIPLVDVSGSMEGEPMIVAIALGILLSETTTPALRNRLLTFESTPQWFTLNEGGTLAEKVLTTRQAPWGGSTDFFAAIKMILDAAVQQNMSVDEISSLVLVVFSDMQFDVAHDCRYSASWTTQYQQLVAMFAKAGMLSASKQPYKVPHIVFWNLRGDTSDFIAQADTPGVSMVSGFSQAALKLFLEGDMSTLCDPMRTLRATLDNKRYDAVRTICAQVGEGHMKGYTFTPTQSTTRTNTPVNNASEDTTEENDGFEMVESGVESLDMKA